MFCEPTCTCKSFLPVSPPQFGPRSLPPPGSSLETTKSWLRFGSDGHRLSPTLSPWACTSAVEKLVFSWAGLARLRFLGICCLFFFYVVTV